MRMKVILLVTLLLTLLKGTCSYFVTVDAHAEECFFDKVKKGTTMGLTFEVAEGGFLDIDVEVNSHALFLPLSGKKDRTLSHIKYF